MRAQRDISLSPSTISPARESRMLSVMSTRFGSLLRNQSPPAPRVFFPSPLSLPAFQGREVPGGGDGRGEIDLFLPEVVVEGAAHGEVIRHSPFPEVGGDGVDVIHLEKPRVEPSRVGDLRVPVALLTLRLSLGSTPRGIPSRGAFSGLRESRRCRRVPQAR